MKSMRMTRALRVVLAGMMGAVVVNMHLYWMLNSRQGQLEDAAADHHHFPSNRRGNDKDVSKANRQAAAKKQRTRTKEVQQDSNVREKNPFSQYTAGERPNVQHRIAGLNCDRFTGGPSAGAQVLDDFVYWRDIPSDEAYISPFASLDHNNPRYLTFELDEGGFNNLRIGLETVMALAYATGRTLVLPPDQRFHPLFAGNKTVYSITDFYHLPSMAKELAGLKVMTFQEFLEREAMTGHLRKAKTPQKPSFPAGNRTNWNGRLANTHGASGDNKRLYTWLRSVTTPLAWNCEQCVAAFPSAPGPDGVAAVQQVLAEELKRQHAPIFENTPTPVDADPVGRLSEILSQRKKLCIYDETMQTAKFLHAKGDQASRNRLLIPFYAFLYFHDWKTDLIVKRFARDHLRYVDEIQCAAARLVQAIRERAWREHNTTSFDTIHLRRNDFQGFYEGTALTAEQYYANNTHEMLSEGRVVYIATDEQNRDFFAPLARHYHLYFMGDFQHLLADTDPNYIGMVDQLIAAQGDTFVGTFYSTFSAYINRVRGYLTEQRYKRQHLAAPSTGAIPSYYFGLKGFPATKTVMQRYMSVHEQFWTREFPVAWRDIDHDVPYTLQESGTSEKT